MKYYSPSRKGFFDPEFHTEIPNDSIELTENEHKEIMDQQSSGMMITIKDGKVICEKREPTQEEIDLMYQSFRRSSYPAIVEQLDMIWHSMNDGLIPGKGTPWFETIADIKDKYPKPY